MSFMEFVGTQQANMDGLIEQVADLIRTGLDEQAIYARLLHTMDWDKDRAATVAVMAVFRLAQIEARDDDVVLERTVAVSEAYL